MKERRHATPHYRRSAERDAMLSIGSTFITGAMLGALIVLMVMS